MLRTHLVRLAGGLLGAATVAGALSAVLLAGAPATAEVAADVNSGYTFSDANGIGPVAAISTPDFRIRSTANGI
jgi:hypothetical protein